ncbi:MAG: KH domain-containing protein [Candidatus Bipolaricaulota bacterium]|nr:KH domain-containing protein [Candidatus Bipolaricaulota bacterium]MCS7274281.1 KH domain-containing protein [Candidatus Bipolaricaulota bacterium]MDW8111468.1 KH domain-containing protein [Candidatus Bipolaricaulota bacterium]MDW8329389.1 KH domain-containing protein [Candidatus Bipolaricaulota bacterium]
MSQVFRALQFLIARLVDRPDQIQIERVETPKVDLFTLSVPKEEMGRLVGRNGRTAEAIRDLLGAIGAIAGKEVILDVIEARAPRQPRERRRRGRGRSRARPRSPSP